MNLTKGSHVAFSAKHLKSIGAGPRMANRRGTYQGLDSLIPGYCRVIWDRDSESLTYADDAEYMQMARTEGELHPVGIICGARSVQFGDTFA